MANSKEFVEFVTEQCEGLSVRPMMGDHVLYYREKTVGGIYDNRLLVKPTQSAKRLMSTAEFQLPYEGAKEMIQVENIEDPSFMKTLFESMYEELPLPKKRRR